MVHNKRTIFSSSYERIVHFRDPKPQIFISKWILFAKQYGSRAGARAIRYNVHMALEQMSPGARCSNDDDQPNSRVSRHGNLYMLCLQLTQGYNSGVDIPIYGLGRHEGAR